MILPTLRQIQYFVAVADTLSFSRAAELCHVQQSTISVSMTELEDLLGEKLFIRDSRHVKLTLTGKELTIRARLLLADAEDWVRLAQSRREPLTSQLVLGVIPTIAPYFLPKLLPHLQNSYPSLDLVLREDVTERQLDALKKGDVDAILMAFPYDAGHVEKMKLWSEPFFLAKAGEQKKRPEQVAIYELAKENILLLDDGHCLRDQIISACHLQKNAGTRRKLGATSLQTLVQMVQHGYGATLLPSMAINPKQPYPGIAIQRFEAPQPSRTIGLVWRVGDPRGAEFRVLGEFIQKIGKPGG